LGLATLFLRKSHVAKRFHFFRNRVIHLPAHSVLPL